jgi:cell division protease FtsH
MSERLGNVTLGKRHGPLFLGRDIVEERNYSEETANKIDVAVSALVNQALENAVKILQANRVLLDQTAEELLKNETLNQPEIIKLKQLINSSALKF